MPPPLPPSSTLHTILLVTKSRSLGPRLVFHYPPASPSAASLAANTPAAWYGTATSTSDDTDSSSSDWDSSTEDGAGDDEEAGSRASGSGRAGGSRSVHSHRTRLTAGGFRTLEGFDEDDDGLGDDMNGDSSRKGNGLGREGKDGGKAEWETVLGFKMDALEKMLTPGKSFNKRRFELGVEGIVFVGAPMFVRDDGGWKKGRRYGNKEMRARMGPDAVNEANNSKGFDQDEGVGLDEPDSEKFIYPEGFEPGYGHGLMSGAASGAVSEAGSDTRSQSTNGSTPDMTMFNIVFVLNPPALEYQLRVKEMYDNVGRKYAKALKYEQAKFDYVWKESKKIMAMKTGAIENGEPMSLAWHKIISSSPLAKSIATIYDSISNDKIAHVHLDATFDTSFQIPQAVSTPYIPSAMEPQMPGLWLTTANIVNDDEPELNFTQHYALLLLEDTETLVKELERDAKDNAIAFYIRSVTPTKSLHKLSIAHSIPSQDIQYIAGHLVYWRRARLIPPLHQRDTYIVSPNADMRALKQAVSAYAARFPTLPSLPEMLHRLSGPPRPYANYIPSPDHRQVYMEILAWLMRGGWVTQLRTFAWVRVPVEIKAQVAATMEREASLKKAAEMEAARHGEDNDPIASVGDSILSSGESGHMKKSSLLSGNWPATPVRRSPHNEDTEAMEASTIISPRLQPYRSPARPSSDAGSTSSYATTVPATSSAAVATSPQSQNLPHRPSPLHSNTAIRAFSPSRSRPSAPPSIVSPTTGGPFSPSQETTVEAASSKFEPSLILSPQKANEIEARWLEQICASFRNADLREMWPTLLKYFDGKHALDDVALREGLKRKRIAALVGMIREGGWLLTVRHW
ncbi:uncharacterized protein BDZ99DRAFT_467106 [Mytilinidion resinicola]|uniref:Nitrogen permease regulator 3 n=1 Tax=Mytilinidion resinicola TaxID=574789 RepID=A0A6A6Y7P2_9PEZI|nr:uncharacterized protein BDZ99DRAFT_467106 [Mytilinidion resinicola]KAF2804861.1 hypothetical protein BDZ99DRAFT_467106 [Mytilinidion resinicola]